MWPPLGRELRHPRVFDAYFLSQQGDLLTQAIVFNPQPRRRARFANAATCLGDRRVGERKNMQHGRSNLGLPCSRQSEGRSCGFRAHESFIE
ncbi:MAG: hypothetical protein DCC68_22585 [Planctomycetota bacterium]|nr:MAG: hypothetical protein DCC68_22585 [Planctomycetota bacterium]